MRVLPRAARWSSLLLSLPATAQVTPAPANQHTPPRRADIQTRPPRPPGPTVHPDGSVTFQLPAPNARSVELDLEGAEGQAMTQGAYGMWTLTTAPLKPEIYGYSFKIDGTGFLDPGSVTVKTNLLSLQNMVEVPGPGAMEWDVQNVPHGVVHHQFYQSQMLARQSDFCVYTPPNYDPGKKYPVLYLLHGYSDDASGWTAVGRANVILDNLIAENRAKPMVVVMPLGYGTMEMITRSWQAWNDRALVDRNYALFTQLLLSEIKPQIESMYSVSKDAKDRAITGLSMGGGESLLTGLNHLDEFAYVGGFSSAIQDMNYSQSFADAEKHKENLKLLWIACGTDEDLIVPNRAFIAWLKQQQVPVTAFETPGRHTWMVWRNDLIHFAPLLFR